MILTEDDKRLIHFFHLLNDRSKGYIYEDILRKWEKQEIEKAKQENAEQKKLPKRCKVIKIDRRAKQGEQKRLLPCPIVNQLSKP